MPIVSRPLTTDCKACLSSEQRELGSIWYAVGREVVSYQDFLLACQIPLLPLRCCMSTSVIYWIVLLTFGWPLGSWFVFTIFFLFSVSLLLGKASLCLLSSGFWLS